MTAIEHPKQPAAATGAKDCFTPQAALERRR